MLGVRFHITPARCAGIVLLLCGLLSVTTPPLRAQSSRGPSLGPSSKPNPNADMAYRNQGPQFEPIGPQILVTEVRVLGNETVPRAKIDSRLKTRVARVFDPEVVQGDVRSLLTTGLFRDVRTFTDETPGGMIVTFQVLERPTIGKVEFVGNRGLNDKALLKQTGLKEGDALNLYAVEEARRKVEDYYRSKGYPYIEVVTIEGNRPQDRRVVYMVNEGNLQRVWHVDFVGNTIATDARLKTQISSKPGFLWYLFGGKVDRRKIDEDIDRLTAYYRSLGFFRARIGREMHYHDSNDWLSLTFVIDEGPRYVVRNVSVLGNQKFATESLSERLDLHSGEYFNLALMNRDVNTLRDAYGSQGHIFADIKADPRFLEEPGQLDLIYQIEEGDQYRVGKINVYIDGEYPHTRHKVVMNRISLRPGDIIDIREVRDSERRLKASQLFENNPAQGTAPRIVVRPPDLQDVSSIAGENSRPRTGNYRGQSPDGYDDGQPRVRYIEMDVVVPSGYGYE
jgi:outer membrane protein insertion porin family